MKLSKLADSLLNTHHNLALIRQDPGTEYFEVAEKVMMNNAQTICQQLPSTDVLVEMATDISKKALHEFLLIKCKEQTMDYTKPQNPKTPKPHGVQMECLQVSERY